MRANAELQIDASDRLCRAPALLRRSTAGHAGRDGSGSPRPSWRSVRPSTAGELVRQSWRDDNFSASEERFFLEQFGHLLTAEDHTARLDRLLWDGRANEAERLFGKVDADRVALARARLGLQAMAPGCRRPDPTRAAGARRTIRASPTTGSAGGARRASMTGCRSSCWRHRTTLGRPSLWWNERVYADPDGAQRRRFRSRLRARSRSWPEHRLRPSPRRPGCSAGWRCAMRATRGQRSAISPRCTTRCRCRSAAPGPPIGVAGRRRRWVTWRRPAAGIGSPPSIRRPITVSWRWRSWASR